MTAAAQREEIETADAPDKSEPQRMLNETELLRLIPIGRATLYRMMREGKFPRGTFVSANRRLWIASEIARWQREVDAYVPNRRRGKGRGRRVSPGPI
ncbi:putative DNA-binding transcriptional regulator AlpA [Bradyrhizobium sp. cir1]|uniref:helix-turn-helix transcriptional regulator n=1 Tax=Bradyrhizobium sp. cir1 TaxID=1445730 RepID=UPI0016060A35|nr:AlpA family phage regulatory protein [Bradyrhizobium sp. cir1]MBB4369112.1 putative DNA-binding transcriptional regulator AlpA [Bradyrhizobium sp. cir1]